MLVVVQYAFALFVAFWVLLFVIVVRPREPLVAAFVVVAFLGIALAAALASTRVPQYAPPRVGMEVGFGYPVHFLYARVDTTSPSSERRGSGDVVWGSPWESNLRLDGVRFLISYLLVAGPLVGGYALAIWRRRPPPAAKTAVARTRSASG